MVSKLNLLPVPSHIESEEEMKEFFEIIARNWRILQTRLDSGDETTITNITRNVSAAGAVPTGVPVPWLTDTAPSGYLLCFGQAVSRNAYAALFAVIGTTFGTGDGKTTFNLPDLRGRVPLGKDNMGGASANRVIAPEADALGGVEGAEKHTLTVAEMPSHSHGVKTVGSVSPFEFVLDKVSSSQTLNDFSTILNTGGGGAHPNMPPYITFNWIIKT